MRKQKLKILLFFILIFGFFFKERAFSQISLGIYPQKLDVVLLPGDSFEGQIKITNYSQMALPISLKISPFGAKEGSGEMEFEKIEPDSPVFWFSFEKKSTILKPRETERIKFKINVPPQTKPGGYYVFIYFEPVLPSFYFTGEGPKIIPMVGLPVLISTAPILIEPWSGKEIEIINFSISKKERVKLLENSFRFVLNQIKNSLAFVGIALAKETPEILITKSLPSSFFLTVKNNDIYHLKPEGKIFLYDLFGREIGKGSLKGQTILPGKSREFEIFLTEKNSSLGKILTLFFAGKVKVKLELKAESPVRGTNFLKSTPSLTFFSLSSLLFSLSFFTILLIIFLIRKRFILALKFLFDRGR